MQPSPDGPPDEVEHEDRRASRLEIALLAVVVLVWVPGFMQLAEVWSEVEYASHGFLVPLVSLWAATAHRAELAGLPARPIAAGRWLLAASGALYLIALAMRDSTMLGLTAVATVVAIVLALRGLAWARTLQFPLAYLLFMVPLPNAWVTPVIVQLQLGVSHVGVGLLRWGGVAIFREGNVLVLPGDVSLFVAEACSGITSLITLLPIGVFIAYFTESSAWRRGVLIAAVFPIALTGNLLRVLLTVLLSIEVSVEFATDGPLHEWAGVATYLIGCLVLIGLGSIMRRLWPENDPEPIT